eukprot:5578415-Pyramimonas_sp.AAC.1
MGGNCPREAGFTREELDDFLALEERADRAKCGMPDRSWASRLTRHAAARLCVASETSFSWSWSRPCAS